MINCPPLTLLPYEKRLYSWYYLQQKNDTAIGARLMDLSKAYQKEGLFLFYIGWKPIVCVFNPAAFQVSELTVFLISGD